jgi:phosphate-selective porin OprO/OprP
MSDPSLDTRFDAAEADGDLPKDAFTSWNKYEGRYFTFRLGGGLLVDTADYVQDSNSKEQFNLGTVDGLRDFRLVAKGQLKFIPHLSYTLGYMYDNATRKWRFRQTGLMYDIPQLYGGLFIGRTKEGFSTSKLMVGYQGWLNERPAISDALIPILGDGIRWTGNVPSGKFVYNLGWFGDQLSEDESFSKHDNQFAARLVWLPFTGTDMGVLHLAVEARYASSDDGFLRYRAKPESFESKAFVIDTGKFPAQYATTIGIETYYRPGPFTFGMEYYFNQVASREENNPFFHGGEVFVSYLLTGETKPYNLRGAYFERTAPASSVFEGGTGAWEVVLRYSYADLDSGQIQGGTFWRVTPMVNWYLSENVRLEFVTGYGVVDRFGLRGGILFGQTRLQLQL